MGNNRIVAIGHEQMHGRDSPGITKEVMPDVLQNLFVFQKIVGEMRPVVTDPGNYGSFPIFAR
ncbi:hypothetical protein WT71_19980 [Burkholderia stagnalis]|nr:hypothetical protein WT71_19980 [Burkholderia stagnalis]KWI71373.1 hypothetical protein WT73_00965 [Burkholderia stagnalis]